MAESAVLMTRSRRSWTGVLATCALLAVFATTATASSAAKRKHHPGRGPSGVAMPVGNQTGWKQVLADKFTGTALDSKWQKYNGVVGGNLGGWWARSHTVVKGGELILKTYSDPPNCTNAAICPLFNNEVSGGVKSKLSLTYGKVLVRVKTTPVADDTFLALLYPTSDVAPPESDFIVDGGPLNLTTIGAFLKFGTPVTVLTDSVDRERRAMAHPWLDMEPRRSPVHDRWQRVGNRIEPQCLLRADEHRSAVPDRLRGGGGPDLHRTLGRDRAQRRRGLGRRIHTQVTFARAS